MGLISMSERDVKRIQTGEYVEIYEFTDRPIEVRWQGHVLPYRTFDKDQRVSITVVVENKRLGHALALVKAKQDLKPATRILTNSEKVGCVKQFRRTFGPDFHAKDIEPATLALRE